MTTSTIAFTVPADRAACGAWLAQQTPSTIADVLEATEMLYTTVASVTQQTPAEIVRAHTQEVQRLRAAHAEEVRRLTAELTPVIAEQCAMEATRKRDEMGARHASEVSLLETQLRDRHADVAHTKSVLEDMHARVVHERDILKDEVDVLKGGEARRLEDRVAAVRAECDSVLSSKEALHHKNAENLQRLTEEVRANATSERARHEAEACTLRGAVARKEEELREARDTTFARMETLLGALTGNSARKGDVGETYVKSVLSELHLGTLTHTGKVRASGFADFAWEYAPPTGAPRVRGIVEVKFSLSGTRERDVLKFHEDVREAAHTGRANLALYLSLVDRVEGRPKLSIEMLHGIPVMWVGRNADDDLSARSLVEMAFSTFAHVWPQLARPQDDAASTLRELCAYVHDSVAAYEKMDAQLKAIEKANETIRANAAQLRLGRDRLLSGAYQFRAKHAVAPSPEAATFRAEVAERTRDFYARKKRYPVRVEDLDFPASEEAACVLQQVVEALKTDRYKQGARKRAKGETPAEEDGDGE